MSGNKLGPLQVRYSRFRQAARGHATWLADDIQGNVPLPPLPDARPPRDGDQDDDDGTLLRPEVMSPLAPARPYRDEVPVLDREAGPPIVPPWVRHPAGAVRRVLAHWSHVAAFHLLRIPQYAGQLVRWSPRGLRRTVVFLFRWVTDAEGRELRWDTAARKDTVGYARLSQLRNQRVHNRGYAVAILAPITIGLIGVGVTVSPWSPLTRFAVAAAVIAVLGSIGAPKDRPWIEHATVAPGARKITPDLLITAFAAAGLCSLDPGKPPGQIRFLSPIAHDGPGVRATIELPAGKTADQAVKDRVKIASGLNIDEFRVFLDRVRGTEGSARRVVVWVADRDPYEATSAVSPLATAETWDFWKPFPFGTDSRGRPVNVGLVWSSLLVGAIPRQGKTYAARLPAAAAALDPTTRLIVFDGKGGTDWDAFELVAHYYGSGVRLPVVEALISVLQDAVEDMNQRYERLRELPRELRPDGKVTPQITRRAQYKMPLTLICVDEVHRYLEHPEHGGTIEALLTELAKVGPASGYMLDLATQRPDAKVIPAGLRDQIGTRFALKVMTYQSSEVILGAGTYGAGHDASKFLKSHKGVGILLGADDNSSEEPATVRTHLLEDPALWKLCERARAGRERAGTLSGMAAGENVIPEGPRRQLLDDLLDVFEPAEDKAWSKTLCDRLADRWPDQYDGWQATTLATTLRSFGIETAQTWLTVDGKGANHKGVTRQQLLDAIAERAPATPVDAQVA